METEPENYNTNKLDKEMEKFRKSNQSLINRDAPPSH